MAEKAVGHKRIQAMSPKDISPTLWRVARSNWIRDSDNGLALRRGLLFLGVKVVSMEKTRCISMS